MREKRSGLPFLLLSTSLSLARLAASQLLRSLAVRLSTDQDLYAKHRKPLFVGATLIARNFKAAGGQMVTTIKMWQRGKPGWQCQKSEIPAKHKCNAQTHYLLTYVAGIFIRQVRRCQV
jgi:hypothetical protein